MELTPIKIPEIPLPFDIPVLMHPPVDHFIIALPIVVLLLEIINLFAKKKAIGVISFLLIILTVIAAITAYLTGSVDGKEAWDLLSQAGQADLKDHKILGTYLMLASAVVLLFKLLSAMINRALMKGLFMFVLIFFVAGILKQGQEGGELVYKYGANTAPAKAYSDLMFTINDDMDDDDTIADLKEELAPESDDETETTEAETAPAATPAEAKTEAPAAKEEAKTEESTASAEAEKTEAVSTDDESTKTEAPAATETEEKAAETPAAPEVSSQEAVTPETSTPETAEAEASTEAAPEVEKVATPPEAQPEVATH